MNTKRTGEATPLLSGSGSVIFADTLLDLRAISGSTLTPVAVLGGYAVIDDGGGGIFYWNSTTTLIDNGGTIIVPTGGNGAWLRVYSGVVNVRWFGAGLGGADDAPPIQKAIEVALHDGIPWSGGAPTFTTGGTVYLPAGNYYVQQPIYFETSDANFPQAGGWISVRLVGDGKFNTHIYANGPDTTVFIVGGLTGIDAHRVRHCEISNLHIGENAADQQRLGPAIWFPFGGGLGFLISDVYMSGVYQGIGCTSSSNFNNVTINNVTMDNVVNCGIYAQYALNWIVSDTIIGMQLGWVENTFGVHLEAHAEGWMWNNVFIGGGDACLRSTNVGGATRPPTEHQFHACNFDEGGRACIWASNMHRCTFLGCWASSQAFGQQSFNGAVLTGVFVMDNADVRRIVWSNSTMVNVSTYCFWIEDAESFSIIDSTFSSWGLDGEYWAILVAGTKTRAEAHMNFKITGNTFLTDPDFAGSKSLACINIQGASQPYYNKYIVANNMFYGADGHGAKATSANFVDRGRAVYGKSVSGNI
jgi:hypothetical protein